MICKHCKNEIPDGVTFCPVCGRAVKQQEPPQVTYKSSNAPVIIGCSIVAAALLVIVFAVFMYTRNTKQTTSVIEVDETTEPTQTVEPEETMEPTPEPTQTPEVVVTSEPKQEEPAIKQVPATHYETYYVTNCYERITLRERPTTNASKVCSIPLGASVSYIESASNGFDKVIYNGKTGYALASYLTKDAAQVKQGDKPETSEQYRTYYVTNCYERITLRKRPDTDASAICDIPLGAAVSYIENAGNGFDKVMYNGNTGYALAAYLTDDASKVNQGDVPSSQTSYPIYYVTGCDVSITLRKSPRTSADEICQIPLGAPVSYIETSKNGFYKVIYNGKTGYALASYLSW